jgi:predicted amidohydrolase
VIGYAEQNGAGIFSAALLIGPNGVIAHYHKTHIVGDEATWCSPGMEKPPVVDLPLGRVGLLIGTDLYFPELSRCLAIAGCDLLVVPAGLDVLPAFQAGTAADPLHAQGGVAFDRHHFHLARQRAFENNCYLAVATPPSLKGGACSAVFGPGSADHDNEIVLASDDGIAVRTIDTTSLDQPYPALAAVRTKELLRMRRTYLYDSLQSSTSRDT